jgi:hypothetical protein
MFLQSNTQPFGKRLDQNQPRWWGKVGTNSALKKGRNFGSTFSPIGRNFGPTFS